MIVTGVLAALVILAMLSAILPAFADDIPVPADETPIVGMAYDPATEQLWVAGPRADRGVIVNAEGTTEVELHATLVSVQALGWHADRLWLGDIGDPAAERDHIVVYRLGSTEGGRSTYHAFDYRYQDGPRDAKAMAISGRGNIYVISDGDNPGIFRIRGEASRERMNTLVRVHDAPAGVTDAVFLSDGTTLALRSAKGIEYIDAMKWEPLSTETIEGAPADESIALGPDDQLYVGGNPSVRTHEVVGSSVSTTVSPEASESPTAEPTPTGSASATETAAPEEQAAQDDAPARSGTIIALLLAAVVAVAAGTVTYFWRN
ncbi:MAG: hypothetical protein Q4G35_12235 [Propionibacteriaceae bacterium]|nr:hypothetical protein [Propionibacteriaceae bacterium]